MSENPAPALSALLDYLIDQLGNELARRLTTDERTEAADKRSPWLAIESAARYLDWPKQRLYKLSASGALPHYKQEGRLLFRRDELDAWLAQFAQGERDSLRARSQS